MKIGYIRVSSFDQNTDRQLIGLELDKVYTDHASGKDTNRPQWLICNDQLRSGDELVVHSLDRLGRSLVDLKTIVTDLVDKGVKVTFVKESLTFTNEANPMAQLMLGLLGSVAEYERAMIRSRQAEGIALARAKGVYSGRKAKLTPAIIAKIKARIKAGEKLAPLAREYEVSRQAIYDALKRI